MRSTAARGCSWIALLRRSDALGFLGTHHLVAVLPVYLISLVEEGVWSPAAGMLVLILGEALGERRSLAFHEALNPPQRQAIACALDTLAAADPRGDLGMAARAARDTHWSDPEL